MKHCVTRRILQAQAQRTNSKSIKCGRNNAHAMNYTFYCYGFLVFLQLVLEIVEKMHCKCMFFVL